VVLGDLEACLLLETASDKKHLKCCQSDVWYVDLGSDKEWAQDYACYHVLPTVNTLPTSNMACGIEINTLVVL
jgi:hypothetical protein